MAPFLKIPFLLCNILCCLTSSYSPNPPPSKEIEKVHEADSVSHSMPSSVVALYKHIRKITMHTVDVIEIVLIVATVYPSIQSSLPFSLPLATSQIRITPIFLLGSFLLYLGTALRAWCFRTLGRHFVFRVSILKDHKLITDGPYSIVRHPAYTGSSLFYAGLMLYQLGSGSWLGECVACWECSRVGKIIGMTWVASNFLLVKILLSRIPKEDRVLKREFGEQWVAWAKGRPYRLVPYVY